MVLTLIIFAGKQHGSLARAGKVRGQTPKVEKQDKKKKKTGRAKRRIQFNRRFVNVVGGQVEATLHSCIYYFSMSFIQFPIHFIITTSPRRFSHHTSPLLLSAKRSIDSSVTQNMSCS